MRMFTRHLDVSPDYVIVVEQLRNENQLLNRYSPYSLVRQRSCVVPFGIEKRREEKRKEEKKCVKSCQEYQTQQGFSLVDSIRQWKSNFDRHDDWSVSQLMDKTCVMGRYERSISVAIDRYLCGRERHLYIHITYMNSPSVLLSRWLYYLRLSTLMFACFVLIGGAMLWGNLQLFNYFKSESGLAFCSIFLFVAAWIGQFIGHAIEGKKPSFLQDLQFLLIGPAWLLHFVFEKYKIKY